MNLYLLVENLTNPALLFFFLGIAAVRLKSDLEIPGTSAKFISLYLLLSIGFKGGQELATSEWGLEIIWSLLFGVLLAVIIPLYAFFMLKGRLGVYNAGAIAAAYGSVSAVTFVTAVSFLEMKDLYFGGLMVAVMALMEAPSIIVGVLLISFFDKERGTRLSFAEILQHSITNGSVLLIVGSLLVGLLASEAQAEGIKPFTTDIFKGFLAVFLLDMGITSGRKLSAFFKNGWLPLAFGLVVPLVNGLLTAYATQWVTPVVGNRFLFAVLAASASYIAVPAAMKIAAPKANPSLYLPMALGITFPLKLRDTPHLPLDNEKVEGHPECNV
ncbi:MAG: sodium-dependent bicarbonate transport family permease [Bacteroidota bacterium]